MEKQIMVEVKKHYFYWNEIMQSLSAMEGLTKYNAQGIPTIEIPDFHSQNFESLVKEMQIHNYQYQRVEGCAEVAKSIEENFFKVINPDRVIKEPDFEMILANGAINCLQLIFQAHMNFENEDEIIMFAPYYPLHHGLPVANEYKHVVHIPPLVDDEGHFKINYEGLKSKLSQKSRFLILTNPNNPTCQIYSREEYEEITRIIKDYPNLIVVEDMAYFCFINKDYRNKFVSFANIEGNYERTLQLISIGKVFNTTGLRFGIAFGPRNLVEKVNKLNFYIVNTPSIIDQFLIAKNLESANLPYKGYDNYWEYSHHQNEKRKDFVSKIFDGFNLKVVTSPGTYYLLLDVRNLRDKIPEKYYYEVGKQGDKDHYHKELDQAFSRMLFTKEVGTFPLSVSIVHNPLNIDYFVRIATNRSNEDLEFLSQTLKQLKIEFPDL